jgi:hypothetical protein
MAPAPLPIANAPKPFAARWFGPNLPPIGTWDSRDISLRELRLECFANEHTDRSELADHRPTGKQRLSRPAPAFTSTASSLCSTPAETTSFENRYEKEEQGLI